MGYLLIETRSPWEGGDVNSFLELAQALARQGNTVDVFLIQNGVLLAREGCESKITDLLQDPNVSIWADAFSLEQRSLPAPALRASVKTAGMPELIRMLAREEYKTIWHA